MGVSVSLVSLDMVLASQIQVYLVFAGESLGWVLMGGALVLGVMGELDCEQSLTMVTRARKARARKSSEASESRGEAGEKSLFFPPLSSFPLGQFALSSPAELRLDWLKRDCSQSMGESLGIEMICKYVHIHLACMILALLQLCAIPSHHLDETAPCPQLPVEASLYSACHN